MGYLELEAEERQQRIYQKVFAFRNDGSPYFFSHRELPKLMAQGFKRISASQMEGLLSDEPPETNLTKEQILEKTLRITFGVLAHRFYALSGALTLLGDKTNPGYLKKNLPSVLRTWREQEIDQAIKEITPLDHCPRRALNMNDYLSLAKSINRTASEKGPFIGNIPLPLVFPESEDRLPSPEEINQEWQKQRMEEKFYKFACACYKLHRQSPSSEFLPWNKRGTLFEASCLLIIRCQQDPEEELKLVVPTRLDCIWYASKETHGGQPTWKPKVYDLKTSVTLDFPEQPMTERVSLAPQLYLLGITGLHPNLWARGETQVVRISDYDFIRTNDEPLTGVALPTFIFRHFSDQKDIITDTSLGLPPDWRIQLQEKLLRVQAKIKEKERKPLSLIA